MHRRSFWFVALAVIAACQSGEPPASAVASAVAGTDRLNTGEGLAPGQSISAGGTSLVYQGDNNLVLYQNGTPLWASFGALGTPPNVFVMQGDCNAVVYNTSGPVWASGTNGQGGACYARVIEGDWFICSGSSRVFSARGGGDCGGGGGDPGGYQCREPSNAVPLPGIEKFRVRIEPDSLYVCDTLDGWEGHFPWPQIDSTEYNNFCVGACGADCSGNTCTRTPFGSYKPVGGNKYCRDVHYDCYATDCCYYHDLCGRMFPTAVFTDPFCHALAIVYGCVACIGPGFNGCSGSGYNRSYDQSYTRQKECCTDRAGDCYNDCTGQCWPGCDVNFDCFDDCTGQYVCGNPFCPDFCQGQCGGFGWCAFGEGVAAGESSVATSESSAAASESSSAAVGNPVSAAGKPSSVASRSVSVSAPDLRVRVGDRQLVWSAAELDAAAMPLAAAAALAPAEKDGLGARPGWSLRDLVRQKLGPTARAVALVGEDGKRIELDASAWDSDDTTPILRVNRKGQLRFHWVGVRNRLAGARGVQQIEVVTDPGPAAR